MKLLINRFIKPLALIAAVATTAGCSSEPGPEPLPPLPGCDTDGAMADCVEPNRSPEYYIEQSSMYFDTMDKTKDRDILPAYSEQVIRWEWPPWLLLTGYTREQIIMLDKLLRLYPSVIPERDCRYFDTQPFGRCRVVFYYDSHEGKGCPIYEEFTFSEQGEITFVEAWSDLPGFLPTDGDADPWAEGADAKRLSTRIPGLGTPSGAHDLEGEWMKQAAQRDSDVADFVARAKDWGPTWLESLKESGDDLWERGCGW